LTSTNPDWIGNPSIATVHIIEFDPTGPGRATLVSPTYTVNELSGSVTLEIARVGGSTGQLQVDIQTVDGTATIGADYNGIPTPVTLTWADGNTTTKTVNLPILSDLLEEGDETFSLDLAGTSLGSITSSTVTIENVPTGKAQFVTDTYSVNETGGSVTLEIARVGGSHGQISFDVQTFNGTATIVDDYNGIPTPITLTWVDGNTTTKTVNLPILDDALTEGDETFTAAITGTIPDWVGTPDVAIVTIMDDEVSMDCETPATADAGPDQTICGNGLVTLSAAASGSGMWSGGSGSFADATMASTTYTPHASELGTTVMLTWTTADPDGVGPCTEVADMIDITLDEAPDAGADNITEVCEGTIVDLLALVSVPGGTFSGPGVSGNSFDTTGLPFGNYQVIYTVSSGNGCPDDTAIITVTVVDDTVIQTCEVLDVDYCDPNVAPFYSFYWTEMQFVVPGSEFFSQNATHSLTFTEFADGTALIEGSTQSGTCSAQLYVVLKDKKNWAAWSADGGGFKPQGCDPGSLVKENLRYYVVDGTKSTITTTGGDCLEEGTFKVTQRPDPADLTTPNLGVHVGPGGALYDSDTTAEGLAGWAWMGPNSDERKWKIDFNFHIDCKENTDCKPEEVCDGIDNDGDDLVDEGFDADSDGIPDCSDTEECDGVDNDGDGEIDEGFDSDNDGTPDCDDVEECDGIDNDGDGEIDEGFDSDNDGTPDCDDTEECDGVDNDGDGDIDEGFDSDNDGTPDCDDTEECDGLDNDGDGDIDEGFDSDNDGTPDCDDTEICDGIDNDGDGDIDEGFDSDNDGTPDCDDTEECDGLDNDGDGDIDEGFDSDNDGTPDCEDQEECDGLDNDGDGDIDEGLDCDNTPPPGCETAYARYADSNSCFIDDGLGANRWGWTNYFATEGGYTMDLYSAAGQCDLNNGTKSGEVKVDYSNGLVTVSVDLLPGFIMTEAQLYIGGAPYPLSNAGSPTVSSGLFPYKKEGLNNVTTLEFDPVDVSNFSDGIHIILHAVTCANPTTKKVSQTVVTPYPLTFKGRLNLQIEIAYSSFAKVKFFDMQGRLVMAKRDAQIVAGSNDLSFNVESLAPGMYILVINTEREEFKMKVIAGK
ncbi:MAG: Calx-beta domain-containing protein, partial [Aurantibacter sp.]